jgi:hypothetical protein
MGLNRGQNIIAGSYMLPRADDNRQVNILRARRHKKREKRKRKKNMKEEKKIKEHKFTPFMTWGLMRFEEKEYIVYKKSTIGARRSTKNIFNNFLEPIPKNFGYSLGGYSHREHWAHTR